jgi:hypothetical protein
MTWRITGAVVGVLAYVLVLLGAIAGSPAAAAIVVTVTALVVLVGGGNWLQHWLGIHRRAPQFARPVRPQDNDGGDTEVPR